MAGPATVDDLHAEGNPKMVDVAGKFVRDEQGRITFAFGKHRGDPVDAHPDFLCWMLRKDFTPSTLAIAQAELDRIWAPAPAEDDSGNGQGNGTDATSDDDIPF